MVPMLTYHAASSGHDSNDLAELYPKAISALKSICSNVVMPLGAGKDRDDVIALIEEAKRWVLELHTIHPDLCNFCIILICMPHALQ